MVFSSTVFLFLFLPVSLAGYYLIKGELKNYWLLFVSLFFFGWSQPNYLWIILLNIIINYSCAMLIDDLRTLRKPVMICAVTANLAVLFYFKYFDFFLSSINSVFGSGFELRNIVLPIGISFFTFQGMSYVIDVYRGGATAQKNVFKVGLYIVLFPQLIAGPIVRYTDIATEIDSRKTSLKDFSSGVERFIVGLSKKAIIANTMATAVDAIWSNGAMNNTWIVAWAGSIAYTLQIYYDFSGYSDMAIGLGRMFGFHFSENFNLPYISNSISDFWRRWHISLSSWFRDYVYIPLGGNRKNVYLNLSIVFLLTGIWHGASWHFIVWGLWNGFFVILERLLRTRPSDKTEDTGYMSNILRKIYALFVINLGWVLFRAPHTRDAIEYVGIMFGLFAPQRVGFTLLWYFDRWTIFVLVIGLIFASSIPKRLMSIVRTHIGIVAIDMCKYIALIALLYLSMIRIVSGTYNPFIYFQF